MFYKLAKSTLKHLGLLNHAREFKVLRKAKTWSRQDSKMQNFYSQFVFRDGICFDVGANRGNRVKVFLSLESNVVGFEPQPHCIDFLKKVYSTNHRFKLEKVALGEHIGEARMFLSEVDTLSTLSSTWRQKQSESGRFSNIGWKGEVIVPVQTLDNMIEKYGEPDFIKVDVEGFELNVIKGLTKSFKAMSIEYSPEFIGPIIECLEILNQRFSVCFNFSPYESMELINSDWIDLEQIKNHLKRSKDSDEYFGDVYIKSTLY
tara:strand:- start:68249 stop:69031 length:783 start_codon:yes stop_codon:yes gene_type:complete